MKSVSKNLITISPNRLLAAYGLGLLLACGLGMLTGCGPMNSSDPTRDYKDVVGEGVPPHKEQTRPQEFIGTETLLFRAQDTAAKTDAWDIRQQNFQFVAGQPGSYVIRPAVSLGSSVVYDLVQTGLPTAEGASFTRNGDRNEWILSWTPPKNFVPASSNEPQEINFQIELRPLAGTSPRAMETLKLLNRKIDARITVRRTEQQPVITAIKGLKETINQGEVVRFTVEVEDPSADKESPPTLVKPGLALANTELYEADGSYLERPDPSQPAPQMTKAGTWVFSRVLDLKTNPMPSKLDQNGNVDESASEVVVRLTYQVLSANRLSSPERTTKVKATRKTSVEAPTIKFSKSAATVTFSAGRTNELEFWALTTNPNGKVTINVEAIRQTLNSWPGKPSLECDKDGVMQNCELSWNVPCNDTGLQSQYTLTVEAQNSAYGKTEGKKLSKTIKIEKKAELCPAPKAAAPAAPAPAKTAGATTKGDK